MSLMKMFTISEDHVQCVNELIKAGASVNVRDRDGFTALMLAVKEDNVQCVKELIKAGADVNIWEFFGYTPLMLAVRKDHKQCVNELIKAGADANAGSYSRNSTECGCCWKESKVCRSFD